MIPLTRYDFCDGPEDAQAYALFNLVRRTRARGGKIRVFVGSTDLLVFLNPGDN